MAMLIENISLKILENSSFVGRWILSLNGLKAITLREIDEITLKSRKA
jgi:hypothetical protein